MRPPPESMVAEDILRYAFSERVGEQDYEVPGNLVRFFEGEESGIPFVKRCCRARGGRGPLAHETL